MRPVSSLRPTDGTSEYLRSLLKYNINPTHPRALSLRQLLARDANKVPITISQNAISYKAPVTIGSQQFLLDLDTGSSDLWVYSSFTETLPVGPHTIYYPLNSTTANAIDGVWNISYRDGSVVSGYVFEDVVEIGGITIEKQAVGAAASVIGKVFSLESDGLLGLSLGRNTIVDATCVPTIPTTLENFSHNPQLKSQVFTCSLTRPEEPAGFFTFGFIDPTLLALNIPQYVPIDPEHGYWEFASNFVTINGNKIPRPSNTAFADTGTTMIMVSDDILPAIYEPLGGYFDHDIYQGWIFPINIDDSKIPTIVLPAGNIPVTLDKRDLGFVAVNSSHVFGSIQSRGDHPFDTFGDYWLRNIYAIWDFGTSGEGLRFGVVPRAASS